jgi:hypothetical protein
MGSNEGQSLNSAIDAADEGNASGFRDAVRAELYGRVKSHLDGLRVEMSESVLGENLTGAPSAPPTTKPIKAGDLRIVPTAAGAAKDDITLDPNFEKEFFVKTIPYKNQKITIKQLGTGFGKPIRIYINDRRWEFFPGPKVGIKAAQTYIDELMKDVKKDPQLAQAMTAQIKQDKAAGVSTVHAPVDAGKPNEVADAAVKNADAQLKHKELKTGVPAGGKKPAAPKAPKPPAPPKPKPSKEVKPQ